MGFEDKPMASVSVKKDGDGWLVEILNADGKDRQERFFYSEAEARAYWLAESRRVNG